MNRMMPFVKRLVCAASLLFLVLTMLPSVAVSAEGPGFTPKEQAKADRLGAQHQKLRSDMYGLSDLFEKAYGYRKDYVAFLTSEQGAKHHTALLESYLSSFDSFMDQAQKAQKKGFVDLGYPNGFDASGKNVVDINLVSSEINAALPDYLTSRGYASRAIYYLHTALLLYHQSTSLDTPSVPKYRLAPYCLACKTAN